MESVENASQFRLLASSGSGSYFVLFDQERIHQRLLRGPKDAVSGIRIGRAPIETPRRYVNPAPDITFLTLPLRELTEPTGLLAKHLRSAGLERINSITNHSGFISECIV